MELIFLSSGRQTIKFFFFLSMVINKQGIPCYHNVYKGIKQNNIKWNNTHDIILANVVLGGLSEEVMVMLRPNK